ncbi:MAG: hypothetical protein ACYCTB_05720 [bacterium]
MKIKIILLGLFGFTCLTLTGCSLMPYSGSFNSGGIKYVRGVNGGYVGSLNKVYKQSIVEQKNNKSKKEGFKNVG